MRFLAIDPGTLVMGLALFDGPDLVGSQLVSAPKGISRVRRAYLFEQLAGLVVSSEATAIAMERPGAGNPAHRPSPLLTLCLDIRQAARSEWKVPLTEYATGTITKAVAPRGWPGDRKAKLRAGVVALMDEQAQRLKHGPDGAHFKNAPQDVVDAIAVGHTHLCKLRETELTGE